jgi:RNA polymerase sigma-70 factor (ECF subfamily)
LSAARRDPRIRKIRDSPGQDSSGGDFFEVNTSEPSPIGPMDGESLGRLLDEHGAALRLYARQFCDCPEDVIQEVLFDLVRQSQTPGDLRPWLYRVARNKAINAARSSHRRKRREMEAAARRAPWWVPAAAENVESRAAVAALRELPLDQREVVVAHVWGNLTFREIGQLTDVSDSTAHRRYLAALTALRERLNIPCAQND